VTELLISSRKFVPEEITNATESEWENTFPREGRQRRSVQLSARL
jgi:hypothetical protein